jgi:uncharacterized protein YjbJ (UPF0337 family)
MTDHRMAGTAKKLGGEVEEGVGRLTGDTQTAAQGMARQAEGALQDLSGQARDTARQAARTVRAGASEADVYVRRTIETRPFMATAIALGIGFVIGRMSRRR